MATAISFEGLMEANAEYFARQARLEPVREAYLNFLCGDVEETYVTFLKSGFGESNRRRFLTVAYQLSLVSEQERGQEFQRIMAGIQGAVDEEVHHDGPDVMNMVGVANAIEKNRDLILGLAKTVSQRIHDAKVQMVWNGFPEFQTLDPNAIFISLAPYNPDALRDTSREESEEDELDKRLVLAQTPDAEPDGKSSVN